jgi:hypothetical protein
MSSSQLSRGQQRRVMYVENKSGDLDGAAGRIGWVTFSRTGLTVYYRNRTLHRIRGGGISGNHVDADSGEEYWVSGVKKDGCDSHWASRIRVIVDDDAKVEYERILSE